MSTPTCTAPLLLATDSPSPWHALSAIARAVWRALARPRQRQADFDFAENLSAATLKDIGAPDWLVSRADHRRELDALRLFDARPWRGG